MISNTDKKTFKSILLLDYVNRNSVSTILNGDDSLIEDSLIELMSKDLITVNSSLYSLTKKGEESLSIFMKRYNEYLKLYDIFGYVDLVEAKFAFEEYFTFNSDDDWNIYKSDNRFEDLRIAVAKFKKINPFEIIFMSFINEGRFETNRTGWQMDLLSDEIWTEISEIERTSIQPEQIGDDGLKDMITQGIKHVLNLTKIEEEKSKLVSKYDSSNSEDVEIIEEEIIETEYYEDPYFISPFWLLPLFIW